MAPWLTPMVDFAWRNALAALPLVVVVALICRFVSCRPSTRHLLWLMVLLWFLVPSSLSSRLLPGRMIAALEARTTVDRPLVLEDIQRRPAPRAAPRPRGTAPDAHATAGAPALPPMLLSIPNDTAAPPQLLWRDIRPEPGKVSPILQSERRAASRDRSTAAHAISQPRPERAQPETLIQLEICARDIRVEQSQAMMDQQAAVQPGSADPGPLAIAARAVRSIGAIMKERLKVGTAAVWQAAESRLRALRDILAGVPVMPPVVWLLGVFAYLFTVLIRFVCHRHQLGKSVRAPGAVRAQVAAAAQAIGLRRCPEIRMVPQAVSPMVCGLRRPRLILPTALWSELDGRGRYAVILHELAHLHRRDHWVCWVELVIGAVYWWHPLVWWVRSRLRAEAEWCCDAWVTWLMPRERRAYACALLQTKAHVSRPAVPGGGIGIGVTTPGANQFARRITMVMTQRVRPGLSVWAVAAAVALASAAWMAAPAWACDPKPDKPPKIKKPAPPRPPTPPRPPKPPRPDAGIQQQVPAPDSTFELYWQERQNRGGDLEARLERLEKQMQALMERLERTVSTAPAPRLPFATPQFGLFKNAEDDQVIQLPYKLPEGKLQALTELMVRSDVPVLVSPQDDHIIVHGTRRQHAIFRAFVDLVDPDTKRDPDTTAMHFPTPSAYSLYGEALSQYHQQRATEMRHRSDELRARLHARLEQARELERAAQDMERESERLEKEASHIEQQADKIREAADQLEGGLRGETLEKARALEAEVRALERHARELEVQAEMLEAQAEVAESEAEAIEAQIDVLEDSVDD